MQRHCSSILFALFAFLAAPLVPSATVSILNDARSFLRAHAGAPLKEDELAELRNQNPQAYAIVKALLTKRSLGLLDPRHPTASFSKVEQRESAEDQGPEAFAKFASPEELRAARVPSAEVSTQQEKVPYAEVQSAHGHRDWLNWKPQSSATDDDTMVRNVLGAVADLKGKRAGLLSRHQTASENPLANDAAHVEPAAAPRKPAPPAAPHENSYLRSIDSSLRTAEVDSSSEDVSKTSSSEDVSKTSNAPASPSNYLTGFSWDDSRSQEEQLQSRPKQQEDSPTNSQEDSKDSLLSWLGVVKKTPTKRVALAAAAQPSNPYIMDLS